MYPQGNIPISQIRSKIKETVFEFQKNNSVLFDVKSVQFDENFDAIASFEHLHELEGRELNFLDFSTIDGWSLGLELSRGVFRKLCDQISEVTVWTIAGKPSCEVLTCAPSFLQL